MIISVEQIREKYPDIVDYKGKISRLMREKKLFQLKKGLYDNDPNADGGYMASYLLGPSYLSFEYALSYYGLISERVYLYTSASFKKRKTIQYKNYYGDYLFQDIPEKVFPYGFKTEVIDGYSFSIADPEKALCDLLYKRKLVTSIKQLKVLLFEDLRIDEDAFLSLNMDDILFLAPLYKSTNLKFLQKYVERLRVL